MLSIRTKSSNNSNTFTKGKENKTEENNVSEPLEGKTIGDFLYAILSFYSSVMTTKKTESFRMQTITKKKHKCSS